MAMHYTTRVDEGYLEVRGATWRPPLDPEAIGRLVVDDHGRHPLILAGVNMGPVRIQVEPRDNPPDPGADLAPWEEVVEISIEAGSDPVLVVGGQDTVDLATQITAGGPGWYRLRVHTTGRDSARDLVVTEPVERYLVQSWPQEHAEPTPIAVARAAPMRRVPVGTEPFRVEVYPTAVPPVPDPVAKAEAEAEAARQRVTRETFQRLAEHRWHRP